MKCPDGGKCHHDCEEENGCRCWRVANCGPLSYKKYPNDEWPIDIVMEHDPDRYGTEHYTRFRDVPKLITNAAGYEVDMPWDTLEHTLARWSESQHVDLDPDFQRGHVWTTRQQIAFVEFGLRGGTSARRLYFNSADFIGGGDLVLVDGKQRLEAVLRFLRNELPAFKTLYADYEDDLWMSHMGASFRLCVNRLQTRAEVLQWYLEINAGGIAHTSDEIERVRDLLRHESRGSTKIPADPTALAALVLSGATAGQGEEK